MEGAQGAQGTKGDWKSTSGNTLVNFATGVVEATSEPQALPSSADGLVILGTEPSSIEKIPSRTDKDSLQSVASWLRESDRSRDFIHQRRGSALSSTMRSRETSM
ncbi:hypothetical protein BH11PSE9_BH11PSE9_08290 [soil metagenome]